MRSPAVITAQKGREGCRTAPGDHEVPEGRWLAVDRFLNDLGLEPDAVQDDRDRLRAGYVKLLAALARPLFGLGDDWIERAACRHLAVDHVTRVQMFFDGFRADRAIAICKACRVSTSCLASALAEEATAGSNSILGVRGGTDARTRRHLIAEGRRAGAVDPEHWHAVAERHLDSAGDVRQIRSPGSHQSVTSRAANSH